MLNVCLDTLSSRKGKIRNCLIPRKNFIRMCPGGASTMDVSYKGIEKKPLHFPRILSCLLIDSLYHSIV